MFSFVCCFVVEKLQVSFPDKPPAKSEQHICTIKQQEFSSRLSIKPTRGKRVLLLAFSELKAEVFCAYVGSCLVLFLCFSCDVCVLLSVHFKLSFELSMFCVFAEFVCGAAAPPG